MPTIERPTHPSPDLAGSTMQTPQAQLTPQPPASPEVNPATTVGQVQYPLQASAPLTPVELQSLAVDLGNYRWYLLHLAMHVDGAEPPQYIKQQYDKAMIRLSAARTSHPNLNEDVKILMNAHMDKLETYTRLGDAGGASSGTGAERRLKPLRHGRVGRLMCMRCRRMRSPQKYECKPLDPKDPRGGCQECKTAGISCDRREFPSEERR